MKPYAGRPNSLVLHGVIAASIVLLVAVLYWPGIHGPFVLDDGENITLNRAIAIHELSANEIIGALLANESGLLRRPLASLSFALNAYFAGGVGDTTPFKLTNIAIHGVNAVLVYVFALQLLAFPSIATRLPKTRPPILAATAALLWAIHPIQLTAVLYVVQRMASLSAFFMLTGMIGFVCGRRRLAEGNLRGFWVAAGSIVCATALGLAAKENAILLPLLAAVVECAFFSRESLPRSHRILLVLFYMLVVVLPFLIGTLYVLWNPSFVTASYLIRDFTLWQRLLTESRVLWFYVLLILLPNPHWLGLFHDDIVISTGLFSPPTTVVAVLLWLALTGFVIVRIRKYPVLAFAVLWFLVCHALESSIFGLEIAYEHRNYLASFGVLFALVVGVSWALDEHRVRRQLRIGVGVFAAVALSLGTWSRVHSWADISTLSQAEVRHHPSSARAQDFAARVALKRGDLITTIDHAMAGLRLKPNEPGLHIDLWIYLTNLGEEVAKQLQSANLPKNREEFSVNVPGLPQDIQTTYRAGRVRFEVPKSSTSEVAAMLRHAPSSVHTVFSLESLRRCVLTPPQTCRDLRSDAVAWHLAAMENPRSTPEDRAILLHNLALFSAQTGDYSQALYYIERASALDPTRLAYRLGTVEYLVRVGKHDKARALLDDIAKQTPDYALYANNATLAQLDAMIAQPGSDR
jgi:protein O-mannosyl-transferase